MPFFSGQELEKGEQRFLNDKGKTIGVMSLCLLL